MFWNCVSRNRQCVIDFYGMDKKSDTDEEPDDEFIDEIDPDVDPCPCFEPPRNVAESEQRRDLRLLPPGHSLRLELFGPGIDHCWIPYNDVHDNEQYGTGVQPKNVNAVFKSMLDASDEDKATIHTRIANELCTCPKLGMLVSTSIKQMLSGNTTKDRVQCFANVLQYVLNHYQSKNKNK